MLNILFLAGAGAFVLRASREPSANAANASNDEVFEVPLKNYLGIQYTCQVTIAGQDLTVIPDTGSFGLLVTSTRCDDCSQRALKVKNATDGYESEDTQKSVQFGSGGAEIQLAHADVQLGPVTLEDAPIWEIVATDTDMYEMWESAKFQGILGLGYSDEDRGEPTVLKRMNVDRFSFCFGNELKAPGILHFGTTQSDKTQVYADVVSLGQNPHWSVALSGIHTGRGGYKLCDGTSDHPLDTPLCAALVDSGTSQIILPLEHVTAVKNLIGPVESNCENWDLIPDITLSLGGNEILLPKTAFMKKMKMGGIPRVVGHDGARLKFKHEPAKHYCWFTFGAMSISSDHGPVWILGMPFFREHLISFDRTEKRIGFGEPCGPAGPAPAEDLDYEEVVCGHLDEDGNEMPCPDDIPDNEDTPEEIRSLLHHSRHSTRRSSAGGPGPQIA